MEKHMKANIILPIAGLGQRFADGGFATPKPLIEVDGKYLVEKSLDSIDTTDADLIFIVRQEHIDSFSIDAKLRDKLGQDIKIISVDYTTQGALSTCLLAKDLINNEAPLAIFTPDCYFEPHINVSNISEDYDGLVCTFTSQSPAHSYVTLDESNLVTRAAEKEVISSDAVGGFYYFKTGSMFVKYAEDLVERNMRSKGEFYICPIYNLLLEDGLKIGVDKNDKHLILGTPEDILAYEEGR